MKTYEQALEQAVLSEMNRRFITLERMIFRNTIYFILSTVYEKPESQVVKDLNEAHNAYWAAENSRRRAARR